MSLFFRKKARDDRSISRRKMSAKTGLRHDGQGEASDIHANCIRQIWQDDRNNISTGTDRLPACGRLLLFATASVSGNAGTQNMDLKMPKKKIVSGLTKLKWDF